MVNAVIVSACVGCVSLRADPPRRFYVPEGVQGWGGLHWYGDCPKCHRPTRHDVLGERTELVSEAFLNLDAQRQEGTAHGNPSDDSA
jgi:hypothetical protein